MIDLGDWNELLAPLFADERYLKIRNFLIDEYNKHTVFPDKYDLYNWLLLRNLYNSNSVF